MSRFRLQVVDEKGDVAASWEPGSRAEAEFVHRLADRVAEKPVGVFRTAAAVREQVVRALNEEIYALKARVRPA